MYLPATPLALNILLVQLSEEVIAGVSDNN